jgi:tetratricopeptide (TPR) repeat protein
MKRGPVEGEPTDWDRMIWYLGAKPRRFGLALATADRLDALDGLRATGATKLAEHGVRVATMELTIGRSVLDQLAEAARAPGDVIFAIGIDRLLLDAQGGELNRPEIEQLNRARDRLPQLVSVPVVAWLTTASARAFARAARDLDDVVVTRYHFATPRAIDYGLSETRDFSQSPTGPTGPATYLATQAAARPTAHPAAHPATHPAGGDEQHRDEAALLDARLASGPLDTPAWLDLAERRATLALRARDHDRADRLLDQVERARAAAGDARGSALAAAQRAEVEIDRGQLDLARAILEQRVVPVLERVGDRRGHALALGRLADLDELTGNLDAAFEIRRARELPVYQQLGERRLEAVTLGQLADLHFTRGELDQALALRRQSLALYDELRDERGAAIAHGRIADIYAVRGDLEAALRIRREIELPTFERLGDVRELAITLGKIADTLALRGDPDTALAILHQALAVHDQLGDRRSGAVTKARIGRILAEQGHADAAIVQLRDAITTFERLGDIRARAIGRSYLATAQAQRATTERLDQGLEEAVTGYRAALRTLRNIGDQVAQDDVARRLQAAIGAREDLAIVRRLHAAAGAHGLPPEGCQLRWGVIAGGATQPLPATGAVVGLDDRIFLTLDNRGPDPIFVHLLDVGLAGKLTRLTLAGSGVRLGPGESYTLGKTPAGELVGLRLAWPQHVERDRLRVEELYAIATDQPTALHMLETDQLASRSHVRGRVSLLAGWLLAERDDDEPPPAALRFIIRRIEFELDPGARAP